MRHVSMTMFDRRPPTLPSGILLVSMIVALGPATTLSQPSTSRMAEEQALARIRVQLGHTRAAAALTLIEPFLTQTPPPALIDQFAFLNAVALRMHGKDVRAISAFEHFLQDYPESSLIPEAQVRLSALYLDAHQSNRAVAVLTRMLTRTSDDAIRRKARRYLRRAYEQQGKYHLAIHTALAHMPHAGDAERRDLRDAVNNLILHKMDERELADILERFPDAYPGDLALIRLIELHTSRGDEVLAERDIRAFLHQFPDHPYARTATALLESFIADIKAHRHVVAVVLPFSGTMKAFGTDAFNGVRLALEHDSFSASNGLGLVAKDSARVPTPLHRDVVRLIEAFNPIALIGPLLAHEVQQLAEIPDRTGVPFLTPTATLPDVRHLGKYWFSTAMTTTLQIGRLVDYAMRHFGYTRFGILAPRTAHGMRLKHIFQQTVIRHGGAIIAAESYQPGTTDASGPILRLTTQGGRHEGDVAPSAPDEPGDIDPIRREQRFMHAPGFDALFLPGRPADVAFLSAQLAFLDITVPLLGAGGWNHPTLLPWGRDTLEGGLFADALFLQSDDPAVRHFVTQYRERFQTDPSIFAVQGYDAMRAILAAVRRGAANGDEVREHLFDRHDLPTLGGPGRFDEGGILDRKVYMIHIRNGRFIQLN